MNLVFNPPIRVPAHATITMQWEMKLKPKDPQRILVQIYDECAVWIGVQIYEEREPDKFFLITPPSVPG